MLTKPLLPALLMGFSGLLPAQDLPDAERKLIQALALALETGVAGGEEIWPGYEIREIPIAIFRRGSHCYLVQHPAPPEGFVEIETELLEIPLLRGPHLPQMNANTAGQVAGSVTAFIDAGSMGGDLVAAATLILHESGHAFQGRAPEGGAGRWPVEDAWLVAEYPSTDAQNNAWGRIEGQILQAALQAESVASRREFVAQFLAVRTKRQAALSESIRSFEEKLELNEGIADYLAIRAQNLAGRRAEMMARLGGKLSRINVGGRGAERDRFYSSGAAQALLLDELDPSWKQKLEESGSAMQDMLAETLADAAQLEVEALARSWGFDELLAFEELASRARIARLRSRLLDVLAADGPKLMIDMSRAGGAEQMSRYDPMNIHAVDASLRVHSRMLQQDLPGGRVSYRTAVVQDLARDWMICALPEDAVLRIDGELLPAPEAGDSFADEVAKLSLEGKDLSLETARSWFLWEEDLLLIAPGAEEEPLADEIRDLLDAARVEAARPMPAAPFEARDLQGRLQSHPPSDARARGLVFFSAAGWARPSHAFVRSLLSELGEEEDPSLLLIAIQCSGEELLGLSLELPSELGLIHDAEGSLRELFGIRNMPAVLWIDAQGNIAASETGNRPELLQDLLRRLRENR